jgi:hypothetical protein
MPADSPQRHQVYIPSSIWINVCSTIRLPVSVFSNEKGSALQSRLGLAEPCQCAHPPAEVSSLGGRRYADDAKLTIRLFARQLFATGTWVLEFSRWNDHLVDLRALKAKGRGA